MESAPIIFSYLNAMNEKQASDLYITVGYPPSLRTETGLIPIRPEPLTHDEVSDLVKSVLTNRQMRGFETKQEMNSSLDMGKRGRYRVNVLRQRQYPAMVIRRIVTEIPSFQDLKLPKIFGDLSIKRRGLILVTGMTGSGKSTTLAAMIDHRNRTEEGHIITIEDPIEYFHEHKKCVVTQREVGADTESYQTAMKNALRQRPDVIMVGEIRDREVMEQALVTAETGHLCLATIHTNNAYQAIERIVNLFPDEMHTQIRLNLATNLCAIVSQRLLPSLKGGMTLALEIMLNEGLIKDLIIKGDIGKIREIMAQNVSLGMRTFDQSLLHLYNNGHITEEMAIAQSDQPGDMKMKIRQNAFGKEKEAFQNMDTSTLSIND